MSTQFTPIGRGRGRLAAALLPAILATALTPKSDRPLFAVCAAGFALLARIVLYLGRVRAA